jgi:hypothetical protein
MRLAVAVGATLAYLAGAQPSGFCAFEDIYPRQYVAYHTGEQDLVIDGKLDDPAVRASVCLSLTHCARAIAANRQSVTMLFRMFACPRSARRVRAPAVTLPVRVGCAGATRRRLRVRPQWQEVAFTEDFGDITTNFTPPFVTKAKVRWNDEFLFVGGWIQDTAVGATTSPVCRLRTPVDRPHSLANGDDDVMLDVRADLGEHLVDVPLRERESGPGHLVSGRTCAWLRATLC